MSTTKTGIGVAALVVAAAIGWSGQEYRAAQAGSAASAAAQAQLDSQRQELRDLQAQGRRAEQVRLGLAQRIAGLRAGRATGAAAPAVGGAPGAAKPAASAAVKVTPAADPKLRGDLAVWFRGLAAIQFGPFFASAGLTPDQQAKMLDLLTLRKTLALGSVVTSLRPEGVSSEEMDQELQDFATAANVGPQYQDYLRTEDLRPVAAVLAANLAYTDAPLTAHQGDLLTQILAANSPAGQPLSPQGVNWEAVLSEAGEVLSPAQLAAFRNEAVLVAAHGITGTAFRPAGTLVDGGEDAPAFVFNPAGPGK